MWGFIVGYLKNVFRNMLLYLYRKFKMEVSIKRINLGVVLFFYRVLFRLFSFFLVWKV